MATVQCYNKDIFFKKSCLSGYCYSVQTYEKITFSNVMLIKQHQEAATGHK